jgi:hypothetical protein
MLLLKQHSIEPEVEGVTAQLTQQDRLIYNNDFW